MRWELKEAISKQLAEIDFRILRWTVYDLRGDNDQEKGFESIPGFFEPDHVKVLRDRAESMIDGAVSYFLHNTLSSNSVLNRSKFVGSPLVLMPPVGDNLYTCSTSWSI
jgi:hypothetical protein